MLLERSFNPMENVEYVMLFRSTIARGISENARTQDIGDTHLHGRNSGPRLKLPASSIKGWYGGLKNLIAGGLWG